MHQLGAHGYSEGVVTGAVMCCALAGGDGALEGIQEVEERWCATYPQPNRSETYCPPLCFPYCLPLVPTVPMRMRWQRINDAATMLPGALTAHDPVPMPVPVHVLLGDEAYETARAETIRKAKAEAGVGHADL